MRAFLVSTILIAPQGMTKIGFAAFVVAQFIAKSTSSARLAFDASYKKPLPSRGS